MDVRRAWDRLRAIRSLSFEAQSRSTTTTGWTGIGAGSVRVEEVAASTILFHESGSWKQQSGPEITFTNVFRWTAESAGRSIRLEHLRFGPEQPVYLFDLVPGREGAMESSDPHVCREDLYSARLVCEPEIVRLNWTVTGPKMNDRIAYVYR